MRVQSLQLAVVAMVRLFAFFALLIGTVSPVVAQGVPAFCDIQRLESAPDQEATNDLRYKSYGNYCEGFDPQLVSNKAKVAIEIISMTVGPVDFDPSATKVFVAAAVKNVGPVSVQFRSAQNFDSYRLDTELKEGTVFEWNPSRVFAKTIFKPATLGFLGTIGDSIVPLVVTNGGAPNLSALPSQLYIWLKPHQALNDLQWRWLDSVAGQCVQGSTTFQAIAAVPEIASAAPRFFSLPMSSGTSHCIEISAIDSKGKAVPGTVALLVLPSQ
ncbi:hypothetical protein GR204_34355 [Rhizobium leguminosarum]|uniref:Uncharacterized protein n=1 Tax=Rhizobium leguminosarum TaxID=384 RepID=A0A6P0BG48_RHILE|nr:hypothetical protein [Rhizobium leguminosarum]NEI38957.1 hypothetical protein [Rhizobium leguminosarum]NEI45687.1 hypothetical protein [Rhizobium leguminosarum]